MLDISLIHLAKNANVIATMMCALGLGLLIIALFVFPGSNREDDNNDIHRWYSLLDEWNSHSRALYSLIEDSQRWLKYVETIFKERKMDDPHNQADVNIYELIKNLQSYKIRLSAILDRKVLVEGTTADKLIQYSDQSFDLYDNRIRLTTVLCIVGVLCIIISFIIPNPNWWLSVIAESMIDPSLEGLDRLNAITQVKETLKNF